MRTVLQRGRLTGLATIAAAGLVGLVAGSWHAYATMPVFDATAVAQLTQQLQTAMQQLKEMSNAVTELRSLTSVSGSKGAVAEASGLAPALRYLRETAAPQALGFDAWNLPKDLQGVRLSSINATADFVTKAFSLHVDKTGRVSREESAALEQRRTVAQRDAATSAYAAALMQRGTINASYERVADLATAASAAQTMMEQQRVTNNLLATIAGELVTTRAAMVELLHIQASRAVAGTTQTPTIGSPLPPQSAQGSGRLGE